MHICTRLFTKLLCLWQLYFGPINYLFTIVIHNGLWIVWITTLYNSFFTILFVDNCVNNFFILFIFISFGLQVLLSILFHNVFFLNYSFLYQFTLYLLSNLFQFLLSCGKAKSKNLFCPIFMQYFGTLRKSCTSRCHIIN